MTFKTVTIKESVYNKLILVKRKDESFSDLLERLSKSNLTTLKKLRGCITYDDKDEILREIKIKRRYLFSLRYAKFPS
jgi:predicted CopG family antitoxin